MLDASVRGWILLVAGAAFLVYAGRRAYRRSGVFGAMVGWGERLIGAGLMLQGGATHFEQSRAAEYGWLAWLAVASTAAGVVAVCVARLKSPPPR